MGEKKKIRARRSEAEEADSSVVLSHFRVFFGSKRGRFRAHALRRGRLPCPRPPAKRIHDRVYETCAEKSERNHVTGADITDAFELGAERELAVCRRYGIRKAILAKWSPSCDASGIAGKLLRENGIEVINVF